MTKELRQSEKKEGTIARERYGVFKVGYGKVEALLLIFQM